MKTALTIGGSDSSGGAGIQADLKTFTVLGVYGISTITAVTAQNTLGVKEVVQIEPAMIARQIDTVASDIQADAVKTGMIGSAAAVEVVADSIKRNSLQPYVCDPVMFAKSGDVLAKPDAIEAIKKKLLPLATVVTPNLREAAALVGGDAKLFDSVASCKDVARRLVDLGAKAAVVKGIVVDKQIVDLYFDGKEFLEFSSEIFPKEKSHGSGCAFSSAITAGLADGMGLVDSIDRAKQLVSMAIQYSDGQGRGTSPVNVIAFKPKKK
ncbi:bifunctional hydroxymethylpyrimidine kinase/phosphomethylpyrimidine kinase [soil metagenome]